MIYYIWYLHAEVLNIDCKKIVLRLMSDLCRDYIFSGSSFEVISAVYRLKLFDFIKICSPTVINEIEFHNIHQRAANLHNTLCKRWPAAREYFSTYTLLSTYFGYTYRESDGTIFQCPQFVSVGLCDVLHRCIRLRIAGII